jgi:hypothetical protein
MKSSQFRNLQMRSILKICLLFPRLLSYWPSSLLRESLKICKEGQPGNKKTQRRGLLVFSELPNLSSAGSRSGFSYTYLGRKRRSLIWIYLDWFEYSKKKSEEGRFNSGLFASKRWKAFSWRLLKSFGNVECKHRCPKLAYSSYRRTK